MKRGRLRAVPEADAPISVKEALDLFDRLHLSTLKDARSVRCAIRLYFPPLHPKTFEELTVQDLTEWANSIRARGKSRARCCVKLMRQLCTFVTNLGRYDGPNRAKRVPVGRSPRREEYIHEHEMGKFREVLNQRPLDEQCYFRIMLTLFPRPGEALQIKVSDLQFWTGQDHRRVGLWGKGMTKNGKKQSVPIPPQLAVLLEEYVRTRPRPSPWLFPGVKDRPRAKESWWHRWAEIRSAAGLDHITIHDLRRTGSTWANDTTGDLSSVSRGGLNHHDLTTTSIYVQTMDSKVSKMFAKHEERLTNMVPERNPVSEREDWPG